MSMRRTRAEVADIIEAFLSGTDGHWDWDDFCSVRIADPELDAIRVSCVNLHDEDASPNQYCGERGLAVMRGFVSSLRKI
jgi:pyruvate kinase